MRFLHSGPLLAVLFIAAEIAFARETVGGRDSAVLQNGIVRLVVDLAGGSLGEFRRLDRSVNPLQWAHPGAGETRTRAFGHFLCLDRWGPPSEAEGRRGMPYHGEASGVVWNLSAEGTPPGGTAEIVMEARLPKAGLAVSRRISMPPAAPWILVRETVRNENSLGRVFNMVQHPTIGAPFLDSATMVDCNGRRGFAQGGSLPNPEEPSSYWPRAIDADGNSIDLRHLVDRHDPNVASFVIDGEIGWITAASPSHELLLGYVWRTRDYPWVSVWRNAVDGKPDARGLEFGTTGLHQPFPALTRKLTIFGRPLFEFLDADEGREKSYAAFLVPIPRDFKGVDGLVLAGSHLRIRERSSGGSKPIEVVVPTAIAEFLSAPQ